MPCATVHLEAADRTLRSWSTGRSRSAPFDATDPELRELFMHGALAPDMGYIPGVDRLVSDLAHYVRSADLARELIEQADSARVQAYAWGWVTHVLADILIHPLIGRACGELLYGSRDLRLNSGAHIGLHVAVEVGLDATILTARQDAPTPPRTPRLLPRETRALGQALGEVYDLDWDPGFLRRSHVRATRVTWRWPGALRTATAYWADGGGWAGSQRLSDRLRDRAARAFLAVASRLPDPDSSAHGMMRPLRPSPWLLASVQETLESFPERFQDLVGGGLDSLANHNLENGIPESSGVQHPMALQTRLLLRNLGSGLSRNPGLAAAG